MDSVTFRGIEALRPLERIGIDMHRLVAMGALEGLGEVAGRAEHDDVLAHRGRDRPIAPMTSVV